MSQSLADYYDINQERFKSTGALDPILDVDTRLFIDPSLLRVSTTPELCGSYNKVIEYFEKILLIVSEIESPNDCIWRQASKMLVFPEVAGLSIGYASKGTRGSGMGKALREELLLTIWSVVKAGISKPALFELLGIFQSDIGPDRISDMLAKIVISDLMNFTKRVCDECNIPMYVHRIPQAKFPERLPTNPITNTPIILVPKEILRDLPVADEFGDISWIVEHNESLRAELNNIVGSSWLSKMSTGEKKERLKDYFIRHPSALDKIISAYSKVTPEKYDFDNDPAGEVIWYSAAKEISENIPLTLRMSDTPTLDEVEKVVQEICDHFRVLIEDNQLSKLLYDGDGKPKHESASQLLFYGVASAYCRANNLDLSPESDAGRGPVDFKMSRGYCGKVLVEVKLTSNSKLIQGFKKQLPIYQKAEGTPRGIYLVIDNGGGSDSRMRNFRDAVLAAGKTAPKVMFIDGVRRISASKAEK